MSRVPFRYAFECVIDSAPNSFDVGTINVHGGRKCIFFCLQLYFYLRVLRIHKYINLWHSPPFIYAHIRTTSEPWIDDEYATECDGTFESLAESRIIVQSQPFAKPMHQVSFTFYTRCGRHVASHFVNETLSICQHLHKHSLCNNFSKCFIVFLISLSKLFDFYFALKSSKTKVNLEKLHHTLNFDRPSIGPIISSSLLFV